jgi:hypothetical protein
MTHDELIAYIDDSTDGLKHEHLFEKLLANTKALRAVVELHKPNENYTGNACGYCFGLAYEPSGLEMMDKDFAYPCATIRAIEKELK